MRLRFGDCIFDRSTRELFRDGRPVDVTPKAFELLGLLLAARPRVIAKQELHEALWPDTFVAETSLARLISEVRKAIGDEAHHPRFVRTAHGYGYAFSGETIEEAAQDQAASGEPAVSRCWLVRGRQVIPLAPGDNLLGREPGSALMIESAKVSRRHTRIVVDGERATLQDLGSKNGTWVEGRRVAETVELADGDQISIGSTVLVFRCGGAESTETELAPPDLERR